MLDAKLLLASKLISLGFYLIPLRSNQKAPTLTNWANRGSSDITQLQEWQKEFPDCNFGVLTGRGMIVLDIDNKNEKNGTVALRAMGEIPDTFSVATPSGGLHYYFKTDVEFNNSIGSDGIDIKSDGGQVVCAGSTLGSSKYCV